VHRYLTYTVPVSDAGLTVESILRGRLHLSTGLSRRLKRIERAVLLNGMPCHTYILKKLRNERDILVFEKAFIETLLSFGFEHDSIETALCLCSQKVLPNSPIYGKEFHLLGEGLYIGNFIDSLWLDHTIPKYDTCHAYYKTFDNHCTACQICVYSPYYRNKQQAEELELLRYAFQSPQNLNQLKNMGLNAVCFRSVYNITQSLITAEQPKLFQLHKILYKLLNSSFFL